MVLFSLRSVSLFYSGDKEALSAVDDLEVLARCRHSSRCEVEEKYRDAISKIERISGGILTLSRDLEGLKSFLKRKSEMLLYFQEFTSGDESLIPDNDMDVRL